MNKYLEKIAISHSVKAHLKDVGQNTAKRQKQQDQDRAAEKGIGKILAEMAQRVKKTRTSEEEYKNILKGTESLSKTYSTLRKSSAGAAQK